VCPCFWPLLPIQLLLAPKSAVDCQHSSADATIVRVQVQGPTRTLAASGPFAPAKGAVRAAGVTPADGRVPATGVAPAPTWDAHPGPASRAHTGRGSRAHTGRGSRAHTGPASRDHPGPPSRACRILRGSMLRGRAR